jgi:ribosomal peptide maturation radical SAM protein 1
MNKKAGDQHIALISAPWPVFNRPSIQLGALSAYLKKQIPGLGVTSHHFFLQLAETIGYELYKNLSERTWIAESVYAALLYPQNFNEIEKFFRKQTRAGSKNRSLKFDELVGKVEKASAAFISRNDWERYSLVGFSICLCQLTSSLYLMREIKARCIRPVMLAGGSLIVASSAKTMLQAFPQIDAAIVGEGEKPLASLVEHFNQTNDLTDLLQIDGLVTAKSHKNALRFSQIPDLSEIPAPDYQDYFDLLNSFAPEKRFFPILSAEISRGCWWQARKGHGEKQGCAFCNLNLQWKGYRSKNPEQVISEINGLTFRHGILSVAFTDNVIPPKQTEPIFEGLASSKKDFQLFCELRASLTKRQLAVLRQAGVSEVQVGIESLSTSLLKKINKGTTAIENLEIMKHCEALSISDSSNLMICFPGSDQRDVDETLRAIEYAQSFHPLKIVYFWLGLESPVYRNYHDFGLKAVLNHPNYRVLFPGNIVDKVAFIIQDYRGQKAYQKKLWRPVKEAVLSWKKNYEKLHKTPLSAPILSYRDGRDFIIIRQRRINGNSQNHRLKGTSRAIYLFCDQNRSIREITGKFPMVNEQKITAFLKMMTQKKLMFEENGNYLSLAVKEH